MGDFSKMLVLKEKHENRNEYGTCYPQ